MKHLFLCTLLLLLASVATAQTARYVADGGEFLSDEAQEALNSTLRDYDRQEGVKFYFYSVASLGGKTVAQAAEFTARRIGLNRHGTNNSALIFLSKKEQKIYIAVGWGLQWALTDEVTNAIKREMIGQFKYGSFYEGAALGFSRMLEYAKNLDWAVSFEGLAAFEAKKAYSEGKVALLHCQVVSRNFRADRIGAEQFSEKYFIYGKTSNGSLMKLRFSRGAFADVQKLLTAGKGKVYGRIQVTNPLDLQFLGLDPQDPAFQ